MPAVSQPIDLWSSWLLGWRDEWVMKPDSRLAIMDMLQAEELNLLGNVELESLISNKLTICK